MKKLESFHHYIQLLDVFTIREIKSRYKASLLGPMWIVLHPVFTALILNFIFGKFIKVETDGIPYFIFVLSGLVVWNFFQQSVDLAKNSLIWERELITKTSFPINTLPLSYVLSKIPDFLVYLILLLIFYSVFSYKTNASYIVTLAVLIPLFFFTSGIALISSLANSIFRDFGRIVEFSFMILFYTTPIIYPETLIPKEYQYILYFNPLALLISLIRKLLFKGDFRLDLYLLSLILSLFVFLMGIFLFNRYSKKIADII